MNTNDKINQDFLKQYSSVFSDKLMKPAYENKQHLKGKDILNLSSIKQLNLFVIKAFFNEWQEEVKKLESPLFDYKSREVRKSMIDFMNTLSQHISIEQKHLKPYVEQALQSTILLASNVGEFLQNEFADKKSTRVSSKFIKSQLKYIVLHKDLLLEFFTSVEGETVREALNKSVLFFEDLDATDTEDDLIGSLSQYLVLDKGDLFIPSFQLDEPEVSVDSEMEETPVDENFDQLDHEPEELPASSSDYFGSLSNAETPEEQPEGESDYPDHEAERKDRRFFEG